MITSARAAITNSSNEQAIAEFSQKSDNVSNIQVKPMLPLWVDHHPIPHDDHL